MSYSFSVIVSTFNSELWLHKVLIGFNNQTYKDFELIVADDGSDHKTRDLIEKIKHNVFYKITHVWQPDHGFQKTIILNKALLKSNGNYIVFTDGDCIPRSDFLETHNKFKKNGFFLSGGYFKLNEDLSKLINIEDISSENCFKYNWLRENGLVMSIKNLKILSNDTLAKIFNSITTTRPSWNGHNSSGWRKDIFSVNGFDERMKYGGEDRELGERLTNFGIRPKQIRYSAICLHLHHKRSYVNQNSWNQNNRIRSETRIQKLKWTNYGLVKDKN